MELVELYPWHWTALYVLRRRHATHPCEPRRLPRGVDALVDLDLPPTLHMMNLTESEIHLFDRQCRNTNSFFNRLYDLMCSADRANLGRLRRAFPDDVEAFVRFSREEGYWEDVYFRATGKQLYEVPKA